MESLVRFGVAMDADLLADLDRIVDARHSTRSEILRDLVRAEVNREKSVSSADAVAALTIVYDHHVPDLTEKLTELQHSLGARVRSSMHVHLSDDYCLEVIVLHGRTDELREVANRILATRGVKRGGMELITDVPHDHAHEPGHSHTKRKRAPHTHRSTRTRRT
ncbi:MAG TPA: nickel-responsive transcriptional regulator NikR [Polyangiaceae bacterium]|jgi:CopG family nickel-responsive transcriptional regulator